MGTKGCTPLAEETPLERVGLLAEDDAGAEPPTVFIPRPRPSRGTTLRSICRSTGSYSSACWALWPPGAPSSEPAPDASQRACVGRVTRLMSASCKLAARVRTRTRPFTAVDHESRPQ